MLRSTRKYSNVASHILNGLKNPALLQTKGLINGEWVAATNTFVVNDPGQGPDAKSSLANVSCFGTEEYNTAIEAADTAFHTFRKTTARERADLLQKMHDEIMDNKDDLAKIISLENGKPLADAQGEVKYAASFFKWFSEQAPHITGDVIQSSVPGSRILALRQPVGVCGIITPWNFPAAMIARKWAAAVAVGCTTVIKPASETPLTALAMAYLSQKAGYPKGVINVLPSERSADAGTAICAHKLVKKVTFTGSTNVGKILMRQSSSTLKKCSFELGGNAPFIVFEDASIEKAVEGVIASKFRSSGQTCVCANRIYVQESIYDEFATALVKKLQSDTVLGYGLDENTTHGPLIHEKSLQKVQEHIKDANNLGAKILLGGKNRPDLGPNYHELTVLGNVTPNMKICQEETFGPVCPLIKFSSTEEVLSQANDTNVGLAGYFYTNDVSRVFSVAEALEVGMVGVNTGAISEASLPFGGIKESGFGREGSKFGYEDYTVVKSVVLGGL